MKEAWSFICLIQIPLKVFLNFLKFFIMMTRFIFKIKFKRFLKILSGFLNAASKA